VHGDDFKEVLEPVLDRVGAFLVQKLDVEDPWSRMSFKWIGLLASTCTTIHAARISLFLSALEATGAAGDAHAISLILRQPWGEKTIIHEVGCKTLLSLLPALEETEGGALNDDDNEEEIMRIACWEHGVSTVIHCLKVNSACARSGGGRMRARDARFNMRTARLSLNEKNEHHDIVAIPLGVCYTSRAGSWNGLFALGSTCRADSWIDGLVRRLWGACGVRVPSHLPNSR
jgi:hypothetical protein